jgi:hypothetical protein
VVGSIGRSPPIYLVLWPAHSLLSLFCIHLSHGGHLQVHLRFFAATGGVLVLFIFVCICKSTLLLMEALFSE